MPAPFSAEFEYLVFSWLHRIWVLVQWKSLWKARSGEEKLPLTQQQPTGPSVGRESEPTAHSSLGESAPTGRPLTGPHSTTCQHRVPGVSLSPPRDYAPHCWFLEQQPHLHAWVALVECGQAGVLRPVKVLLILGADVQSYTQQECWCPWEGGTSV